MSQGGAAHGAAAQSEEEQRRFIEGAFRSQSVWDWTMADSVARAVENGSKPVCLVIGRFHSDFDGGLIQALQRLRPGTRITTISFVSEWSESLRDEDRGRADFVIYVGPEARATESAQ
jgi:uncharacterized iron-regulated protein